MTMTLDGIALPEDLYWSDETTPWAVGQTVSPTLTGALVIQEAALQTGRPITLESQRDGNTVVAVVERSVLDQLLAMAALPNVAPMTLVMPTYGGGTATYTVRWRRVDGPAIEAEPIVFKAPIAPGDFYTITLRLMQVS